MSTPGPGHQGKGHRMRGKGARVHGQGGDAVGKTKLTASIEKYNQTSNLPITMPISKVRRAQTKYAQSASQCQPRKSQMWPPYSDGGGGGQYGYY